MSCSIDADAQICTDTVECQYVDDINDIVEEMLSAVCIEVGDANSNAIDSSVATDPCTATSLQPTAGISDAVPTTQRVVSISAAPSDIRELTIKNLDTGEEFIIGENDPDFEYDTYEISVNNNVINATDTKSNRKDDSDNTDPTNTANTTDPANATTTRSQHKKKGYMSWFRSIISYFYTHPSTDTSQANADTSTAYIPQKQMLFTKLSSFKFRRELGRGAFGRVLLAEAKIDGKLYALKIISKKNMRTSDKRQAKAERDILYAMNCIAPHPFTASLKFAFQSENNLYLGMDYIPGGNLRELIRFHGHLKEDWVKFYSAELVLAISHLHSINVLYRDIKPHNVMIDAAGHITLIDFGLSKLDHTDKAMTLVGTPDYSAPEVLKTGVHQIEKHKQRQLEANKRNYISSSKPKKIEDSPDIGYGKAADWWSLGVMIYEMISGMPAFRGNDLRQTYQKVLFSEVEFKPQERFTDASKELLLGLLVKDPNKRLGTVSHLDIMNSAFFTGIVFDDIYHRTTDGPMIPPPIVFSSKQKKIIQEAAAAKTNATTNVDGTIDGNDTNSIHSISNHSRHSNHMTASTPSQPVQHTHTLDEFAATPNVMNIQSYFDPTNNNHNSRNKSTGSLHSGQSKSNRSDTSSDNSSTTSEVMQIRESIIGGERYNADQLIDWSFIDESVLASAMSAKQSQPVGPVSCSNGNGNSSTTITASVIDQSTRSDRLHSDDVTQV